MKIEPRQLNIKNDLPCFSQLDLITAVDDLKTMLSNSKKKVDTLVTDRALNLDDLIRGLETIENELELFWSPFEHLNAVKNTDALRDVYSQGIELLSEYSTAYGQNVNLYDALNRALKSYSESDPELIAAAKHIIDGQKLSGVHLDSQKKEKYKDLSLRLSKLSDTFSNNVLDANKAWTLSVTEINTLKGLPDSQLELLKTLAKQRGKKGYLITLDYPAVNAILTYANNRKLREQCYKAFITRASEQAENTKFDNTNCLLEILSLKKEQAKVLGFKNYAEYSLDKKMADSSQQVISFLENLLTKSINQAKTEILVIQKFAQAELNMADLKAWDMAYVQEKYKQQVLAFDSEELKPWFSLNAVLKGMFQLVSDLYGFTIVLVEGVDVWDPEVTFYQIQDDSGSVIAGFYLDMYARENKRGGAWMNSYSSRIVSDTVNQLPIAYLTCNAAPPSEGKPALLDHDEVVTLFHEFGHGLHHMLTQVNYLEVSGISGVEWDAVELPSQLMENWCWNKEALSVFANHYESGEPLPDVLFDKLLATRNYNSALSMLRQLEFSLIDMHLHLDELFNDSNDIQVLLDKIRSRTALVPVPEYSRTLQSFGHIFGGGYAAGYYSYKWAEVLSADVYCQFEQSGFDKTISQAFYDEVLSKGGARSAKENFIAFMGREPSVDALLRDSGIC